MSDVAAPPAPANPPAAAPPVAANRRPAAPLPVAANPPVVVPPAATDPSTVAPLEMIFSLPPRKAGPHFVIPGGLTLLADGSATLKHDVQHHCFYKKVVAKLTWDQQSKEIVDKLLAELNIQTLKQGRDLGYMVWGLGGPLGDLGCF